MFFKAFIIFIFYRFYLLRVLKIPDAGFHKVLVRYEGQTYLFIGIIDGIFGEYKTLVIEEIRDADGLEYLGRVMVQVEDNFRAADPFIPFYTVKTEKDFDFEHTRKFFQYCFPAFADTAVKKNIDTFIGRGFDEFQALVVAGDEEFGIDTFLFKEGDILLRVVPDHVGMLKDILHIFSERIFVGMELLQLEGDVVVEPQFG